MRDVALAGLSARLYHPRPGEVLSPIFFLHGGGWVCGTVETHDAMCRALAARSGLAVVSLDYPRAPESRFPEPLEACWRALQALGEARLELNARRIAVAGQGPASRAYRRAAHC